MTKHGIKLKMNTIFSCLQHFQTKKAKIMLVEFNLITAIVIRSFLKNSYSSTILLYLSDGKMSELIF